MASPNRVPPRVRHDDRPLSQRGIRQPILISAEDKAEIAFRRYHHDNPHIFAAFRTLALRLYRAGVTHYGAKALMEIVRYETIIRARTEPLKINNNHTSRYARLLMEQDSRFDGFFSVRELRPSGRKVRKP